MIRFVPRPEVLRAMQAGHARSDAMPPAIAVFLQRLRHLPLGSWMEAGQRLEELDERDRRTTDAASGTTVRTHLRHAVNDHPHLAARVRQQVLDLVAVAQDFVPPSEVARMKKAALAAGLAVLARPTLGEAMFRRVYEPFAALIPLPDLAAERQGAARAAGPGNVPPDHLPASLAPEA